MFAATCYFHPTSTADSAAVWGVSWALGTFSAIALRTMVKKALMGRRWWGVPTVVIAAGGFGVRPNSLLSGLRERGLKVVNWVENESFQTTASGTTRPLDASRLPQPATAEYAVIATPGLRVHELSGIVRKYGRFRRLFLTWDMGGLGGMGTDSGGIATCLASPSVRTWPAVGLKY